MKAIARRTVTLGMPHLAPEQLSEVELLKLAGDLQWQQLGTALGCPPHRLFNESGDRLYASFINIDACFRPGDISQFQEGDVLQLAGTMRFYAKQFAEGWIVLSKGDPVDDAVIGGIETKDDLAGLELPWVYMTNALVARVAGNVRLRTFRPAGIQKLDVPETQDKPVGMSEHEQVLQTGKIDWPSQPTVTRLPSVDDRPILYQLTPENDLNGAGLLYFARYVAMMNYAERRFLLERLQRPFSTEVARFLSTEHRRTYYFANAAPSDQVAIYCSAALIDRSGPVPIDATRTTFLEFLLDFELYRKSDGVLMARSTVQKALTIPNRIKSLHAEARRFAALFAQTASR